MNCAPPSGCERLLSITDLLSGRIGKPVKSSESLGRCSGRRAQAEKATKPVGFSTVAAFSQPIPSGVLEEIVVGIAEERFELHPGFPHRATEIKLCEVFQFFVRPAPRGPFLRKTPHTVPSTYFNLVHTGRILQTIAPRSYSHNPLSRFVTANGPSTVGRSTLDPGPWTLDRGRWKPPRLYSGDSNPSGVRLEHAYCRGRDRSETIEAGIR